MTFGRTTSHDMAEEKWYQKNSVQVAMVTGAFAVIVAIIGVVFKGQAPNEPQKTTVSKSALVPLPGFTGAPNLDRSFSAESAAARNAIRGSLRNTSAAESGLNIDLIPPGSFGFAHPSLFRYGDFKVDRFPTGRLYFEIHKLAPKQVYAIAFVNADTQRQINLDSKLKAPVTLYSDMWPDAPYAVRVDTASCRGDMRIVSLDDGGSLIAVDCAPVRLK